jgi:hypothetical protein
LAGALLIPPGNRVNYRLPSPGLLETRMFASPTDLGRRFLALAAGFLALAACATPIPSAPATPPAPAIGLYELRIYTAAPGKMDALNARFRDHTVSLFKKHGMTPVAFYRTVDAQGAVSGDKLYYIMGYKDRATRDASWQAFATDPAWRQVYADSQKDGSLTSRIENQFLAPAEYSPPLNTRVSAKPRLFELRTYTATEGKLENIHARFRDHTISIFARHGMTNMLYWRPTAGQDALAGKMVYLLAFPDVAARNAAWQAFAADPEWKKVSDESQKDGPILAGRPDSVLLAPTDYSPLK